jgi:hypothetical protein
MDAETDVVARGIPLLPESVLQNLWRHQPDAPWDGPRQVKVEDAANHLRIVYVSDIRSRSYDIRHSGFQVQRQTPSGHWVGASGIYQNAGTAAQHYRQIVRESWPICERCHQHVDLLLPLSADGLDWESCQSCIDAYDRMQRWERENADWLAVARRIERYSEGSGGD